VRLQDLQHQEAGAKENGAGKYPFPQTDGVVPGSDGAGEVVAVGSKVQMKLSMRKVSLNHI
jgi:NADPH:quinone reductase-like Zn-dependent oxidoreductase